MLEAEDVVGGRGNGSRSWWESSSSADGEDEMLLSRCAGEEVVFALRGKVDQVLEGESGEISCCFGSDFRDSRPLRNNNNVMKTLEKGILVYQEFL